MTKVIGRLRVRDRWRSVVGFEDRPGSDSAATAKSQHHPQLHRHSLGRAFEEGRTGTSTATFRTRRFSDRAVQDARNRQLGLAGERAVVAREREWLGANGRQDLADAVRHVAALEGDGAGYDVASFELDGSERFIEVKTTRGGPETDFFISANELEFSTRHPQRVVSPLLLDPDTEAGNFYVRRGALTQDVSLQLQPVQFRVRVVESD